MAAAGHADREIEPIAFVRRGSGVDGGTEARNENLGACNRSGSHGRGSHFQHLGPPSLARLVDEDFTGKGRCARVTAVTADEIRAASALAVQKVPG